MSEPVLSVRGIVAGYGGLIVVHGADLSVAPGEIVALAGGNGAGKSTLLAAISGVLRPVLGGTVTFDGAEVQERPCHDLVARGLVHVLERRRLAPFMTVDDNVMLAEASVRRSERAALRKRLDDFRERIPVLRTHGGELARNLSGGQQQIVAVVRGLLPRPQLLLLDEPLQGLDARAAETVRQLLLTARAEGAAVLFTEHRREIQDGLADRGLVIERGEVHAAPALARDAAGAETSTDPQEVEHP